ncbi:MAG: hypothetical protein IPL49_20715 [Saprospirales bacterium]|nr:hypothetical protein [Saprospirales bacterium]MBK8493235.1 hypothetical protein [Saprospirales bacterium]
MKKFFILSTLLCLSFLTFSQTTSLEAFNQSRLQRQRTAMTILGTWAIGNMAAGAVLQGRTTGETKYFHQMNIGWNAVNLVIAGAGYLGLRKLDAAGMGLFESMDSHYGFQKILLFNAGLDVGYMLGGAYLMERSKNTPLEKKPDRLKGFGQSIVLQGAFLFLFDLGSYFWISTLNSDIPGLINQLEPASQGIGLSLRF